MRRDHPRLGLPTTKKRHGLGASSYLTLKATCRFPARQGECSLRGIDGTPSIHGQAHTSDKIVIDQGQNSLGDVGGAALVVDQGSCDGALPFFRWQVGR